MYVLRFVVLLAAIVALGSMLVSCSKETPRDVNLLENGSFEDVVGDVPAKWRILNFRGLADMKTAVYGVTDSVSFDGDRSFYFEADGDTERFLLLAQEVKIEGARRVRIRGAIKGDRLGDDNRPWAQANFAMTFMDKDRARFESSRFADVITPTQMGTTDGWVEFDRIYRVPPGAAIVVVGCVLGMSGQIWFDNVSLEIPTELNWRQVEGDVFTHHYMPGHEYPEGSIDFQRKLYEIYSARLGIGPEDWERIDYYYYPDTTTLRETFSTERTLYVDYDAREIHSVNPADDHEIIHLLTHPWGVPPPSIAEGTAFYLIGEFDGQPIQPTAQRLLKEGNIPPLSALFMPSARAQISPGIFIPASASFCGYLLEYGGTERFLEFHRHLNGALGFNGISAAFTAAYGGEIEEAERVWLNILNSADFSKSQNPAGDGGGQE